MLILSKTFIFKKNNLLIIMLIVMLPVFLFSEVRYLSEEEYKDLSKNEALKYWEELENEMMMLQIREADARNCVTKDEVRIVELNQKIQEVEEEYDNLYNALLTALGGLSHSQIVEFQNQLDEIKAKLDYYGRMPDSELYKNNKEILAFIDKYNEMKDQKAAKIPEFALEFKEIDRRVSKLRDDLKGAKPPYYEDTHVVVKGEYLWKISGYKHIYNDPVKWGIIYRANRDQIKDPDLIYPDQVFKIPRGLPTTWRVYRGECLWTISSYPEIYNDPFKWPQIYRANTDQIKDPDLIYPNQILQIPRD
ncbi:MAG: LysM peptidoglycan-binding domain-containing protein [Candidatus Cloacimonetes bacterium]|nr:LysM peptidoglycan-binding domain-containing protein [Candidatus Cloacimonadota bacterium]